MTQAKRVKRKNVRYAVVGVGWISQQALLPGAQHTGNSEVVALVTGHREKGEKVGEKYGIERVLHYGELEGLLHSGDIDAVYLATPNFAHVQYGVQTLDAGIPLLLEKPMAIGVEECDQLLAASRRSGAKLMIAYRLHFDPAMLKAIERVRAGEIGTLRFFNSSFSQPVSGQNHRARHGFWAGPVPDMGPYPINTVRNLFGAEPIEVYATGVCTDPERFVDQDGKPFHDTVAVTLKFERNRVAAFVLSYNAGDVDEFRIVGERGDLFAQPAYQVNAAIQHTLTVNEHVSTESFRKTDQFGGELKYFSECILGDRHPEPDGEEGLLDVRIIAAIERALLTGSVQALEPYYRSRRPDLHQGQTLSSPDKPELVDVHRPAEGR